MMDGLDGFLGQLKDVSRKLEIFSLRIFQEVMMGVCDVREERTLTQGYIFGFSEI